MKEHSFAWGAAAVATLLGAANAAILTWDRYNVPLASPIRSVRGAYDDVILGPLDTYLSLLASAIGVSWPLPFGTWGRYTIVLSVCAATVFALFNQTAAQGNMKSFVRSYARWLPTCVALGVVVAIISGDAAEKVAIALVAAFLADLTLQVMGYRPAWSNLRFDAIPIAWLGLLVTNLVLTLFGL